jgi:hypothetical protein
MSFMILKCFHLCGHRSLFASPDIFIFYQALEKIVPEQNAQISENKVSGTPYHKDGLMGCDAVGADTDAMSRLAKHRWIYDPFFLGYGAPGSRPSNNGRDLNVGLIMEVGKK